MRWFRILTERADRYAAQSNWRDFALVKLCLCSMGVLLGMCVPPWRKRQAAFWVGGLFFMTYIALLFRFLPFLMGREKGR